jgi:uncharacterized membrane protein
MAALAYVLLPVTGLLAYLKGSHERVRWHGLQAIALGVVWPAALYVGAWISPGVTQAVFVVGAVIWLGLIAATALNKDVPLPLIGRWLRRAASVAPAGAD